MASRDKSAQVVSPTELLKLGLTLMATWRQREAHDPRLNAMDYRDGLLIALLVLCPLRHANLAQIRIGRHLLIENKVVRLRFAPEEMKGGRALDVPFPEELVESLQYYLDVVRPILATGPKVGDALWPNMHKKPIAEHAIYTRMIQITENHFGHLVTPHMFRDTAATFIAEMTPDRALMAAAVLQHRSFASTMRHYIHGSQHKASRYYQGAIAELLKQADHDGPPM